VLPVDGVVSVNRRGQLVKYDRYGRRWPAGPRFQRDLERRMIRRHRAPAVPRRRADDEIVLELDPMSRFHSGTAPPPASALVLEAALLPGVRP
jgi:hypothetical protein